MYQAADGTTQCPVHFAVLLCIGLCATHVCHSMQSVSSVHHVVDVQAQSGHVLMFMPRQRCTVAAIW